jgi:hypothetical protein
MVTALLIAALQFIEAADHRFDPMARQFVFALQLGALAGQLSVLQLQRLVFRACICWA